MNIAVIYGNTDKTNTYNCVQLLLNKLKLNITISVTEFFLQKDSFYMDDFSYHINSYGNYPDNINLIVEALTNSDLIIFASSVYLCDISIEMKTLLDYLSQYTENSLIKLMRTKIGIAISTTSGAGLLYTTKTLKRNLNYLGICNTFKFSKTIYEIYWDDINIKTKEKINRELFKLSKKILILFNKLHNANTSTTTIPGIAAHINTSSFNIINLNSCKSPKYYHDSHTG